MIDALCDVRCVERWRCPMCNCLVTLQPPSERTLLHLICYCGHRTTFWIGGQ